MRRIYICATIDLYIATIDLYIATIDVYIATIDLNICSRWRSSEGAFALCSYPFLLDADAKSRLLKVDAQAQQAAHFQQSVIMGLLMPTMESSPFLEVCV